MKRLFDFIVALFGLLVLAFPLFLLYLQVRRKLGRPALFKQIRSGLHGRPFTLVKFRTMTDERGLDGMLLPDSQRLTNYGRFLRSTSLDELPELWNVLTGDMSFVGPRPLLVDYLPLYSQDQARRHEVRPGITGWAQICGRNSLSWEDRFRLDVWYVDNRSLCLDIGIFLITIWKVIRREGISAAGEATMTPFVGTSIVSS